jgi:replicative DNA helicase
LYSQGFWAPHSVPLTRHEWGTQTAELPVLLPNSLLHHRRLAQLARRNPMPQVALWLRVLVRMAQMRGVGPIMPSALRHRQWVRILSLRSMPIRILHRLLHRIAMFL